MVRTAAASLLAFWITAAAFHRPLRQNGALFDQP